MDNKSDKTKVALKKRKEKNFDARIKKQRFQKIQFYCGGNVIMLNRQRFTNFRNCSKSCPTVLSQGYLYAGANHTKQSMSKYFSKLF